MTIKERLLKYYVILTVLTVVFTLIGFLGNYYYLFDIVSQFRFQYFLGAITFLILYLITYIKTNKLLLIILPLCSTIIINGYFILPYLGFNFSADEKKPDIKIFLSNVLTSNKNYKGIIRHINKENPDIIILQEIDRKWLSKISSIKETYIYNKELSRWDNFGISMYSKQPVENVQVEFWGYTPVILFETFINKQKIKLVTVHTTPPYNQTNFINRNKQLKIISDWVKKDNKPSIVIGDLNTSMFSPAYKTFEAESGLISSRKGKGIHPTWNTGFNYFIRIPLDYILHSKDFKATNIKILDDIGSDHLPVLAELRLK